jgi:hypothetical protein
MKSPTDSHSRLSPICEEPSIATLLLSSRLDQKERCPEKTINDPTPAAQEWVVPSFELSVARRGLGDES